MEHIPEWHRNNPWLARDYRRVPIPDESYFQCILANTAHLRVENDNRRYVDWSENRSHPKTLGLDDLSAMTSSGAHFARKFEPASGAGDVLDRLDAFLGID